MLRSVRLLVVTFLPTVVSRLRRGPLLPSWTFVFEWMVRMLRRDWDETASWPLPRQREEIAARIVPRKWVKRVAVRDEIIGGVPVRRFVPEIPGGARVVYFHGGSYVYGSTKHSHGELCAHLAIATSLEVIGVEYRLAPEHPWPAQLEDALAVCRALAPAPIVLAGDSAGGHLAVKTAHAVAARALVLVSPWCDLAMPARSVAANDAYEFGTVDVLRRHARAVAGEQPIASLALANDPLGGLPKTFVTFGGAEVLQDDMRTFVDELRKAGVDCTLHVAPEMPHDPPVFAGYHPAADEALEAMARFVREATAD